MAAMDDEAHLRRSVRSVFDRMAGPVLWQDLRLHPEPQALQGYLTRGSGEARPWEFRFGAPVPGLAKGSLLWMPGQEPRWRVLEWVTPSAASPLWAARVEALTDAQDLDAPGAVTGLLDALDASLRLSTLAGLERDDATEALARLRRLASHAHGHAGVAVRVAQRLTLLKSLLGACPQCGQAARGQILRLEAAFRRLSRPD
jgi:hypothetical protein